MQGVQAARALDLDEETTTYERPMTNVDGLDDEDLMSLWIGRVSQKDAELDANLHWIHQLLTGRAGYGRAIVPMQIVHKLKDIHDMVRAKNPENLADFLEAISIIRRTVALRNTAIHGLWVAAPGNPAEFHRQKSVGSSSSHTVTWNLEAFEHCWNEYVRAGVVTGALMFEIHSWEDDLLEDELGRLSRREHMNGRFEVTQIARRSDGGMIRTTYTDPAVEEDISRLIEKSMSDPQSRHRGEN